MAFGQRLQELRKAAGMSQTELAARSGTAIDTLRKWEQGRTLPSIEAAARLATALGVSLDQLGGTAGAGGPARKKPRGRLAGPGMPPAEDLQGEAEAVRRKRKGK
jgi:transcriptional regulator with XRE-family HTH domain